MRLRFFFCGSVALAVGLGSWLAAAWPEHFAVWLLPLVLILAAAMALAFWRKLGWIVLPPTVIITSFAFWGGMELGVKSLDSRIIRCMHEYVSVAGKATNRPGHDFLVEREDSSCVPMKWVRGVETEKGEIVPVFQPEYPSRVWIVRLGRDFESKKFLDRCLTPLGGGWFKAEACPGEEP